MNPMEEKGNNGTNQSPLISKKYIGQQKRNVHDKMKVIINHKEINKPRQRVMTPIIN